MWVRVVALAAAPRGKKEHRDELDANRGRSKRVWTAALRAARVDRTPPAIAVRNLGFAYPGDPPRPALDGLSFEVMSGELVSVIGANGTGKSTLLKLIAGLLDAWTRYRRDPRQPGPRAWP